MNEMCLIVAHIIIINLLSWQIFPASGGWPVISLLSSSNPLYPLHPVALLPSFSCLLLPHQSIISQACLSFSVLLFSAPTLSVSPPPHLFLQYVQTTSNLFCLKCSSISSTPTLNAFTILSTMLQNITSYIYK